MHQLQNIMIKRIKKEINKKNKSRSRSRSKSKNKNKK